MSEAKAKYLEYLRRYAVTHHISQIDAHRHMLLRDVAEEYGVPETEMAEIENELKGETHV